MVVDPSERGRVALGAAANREGPNREDRRVSPRPIESVEGLHRETSLNVDPGQGGSIASVLHHVGGDVRPVNIKALGEQRHEEPTGAAPEIQRRLPKPPDGRPQVCKLNRFGLVDLGPPSGDEPVMPRASLFAHGRTIQRQPQMVLGPALPRTPRSPTMRTA